MIYINSSDEKWDYIKKQPLLAENKALKKFLKELEEEESEYEDSVVMKQKAAYVPEKDEEEFSPYIPEDHFMTEFKEDVIREIWNEQKGCAY